ncbi:tyrosine-type recombinase/integrase [Klebsiella pneumoniae]|uniref:tyrosine-type recombinase/integrase n=1 Tax=Klebsiella pneumoniae TaxID=573 RepID=UPI003A5CFF84
MGITGPSQRRSRRASATEVDRLYEVLKVKAETAYTGAPLHQIFMFSILTCMRVGEVCRLLWEDVDDIQRSVIVRDRKDPRKKIGNHMLVPLLGDAWRILTMQPRVDDRVFPFNPKSITAMYRRVRDELGIEDLRYHDLRREGASRLFEAGFSIEEVAQVTGHRSLNILWQVYTELFPKTLHEKFDKLQKSKTLSRIKSGAPLPEPTPTRQLMHAAAGWDLHQILTQPHAVCYPGNLYKSSSPSEHIGHRHNVLTAQTRNIWKL